MTIGIIGAMKEEISLLLKDIKDCVSTTIAMRSYHCGTLYGKDVVIAFSRWGKVAAAATVTVMIERFGAGSIIFTGVAGSADSKLKVGDIVIADKLVQHDMDVSAVLEDAAMFEIPLLGKSHFSIKPILVQLALEAGDQYLDTDFHDLDKAQLDIFGITSPSIYHGLIASGDQFIADPLKLSRLKESLPDLLCVEMEGASVGQICYEYSIDLTVIRVISDSADNGAAIDFLTFVSQIASFFTCGIVKQLLTCDAVD